MESECHGMYFHRLRFKQRGLWYQQEHYTPPWETSKTWCWLSIRLSIVSVVASSIHTVRSTSDLRLGYVLSVPNATHSQRTTLITFQNKHFQLNWPRVVLRWSMCCRVHQSPTHSSMLLIRVYLRKSWLQYVTPFSRVYRLYHLMLMLGWLHLGETSLFMN